MYLTILIIFYGQGKPSEARMGQGAESCSYYKENKVHYLRLVKGSEGPRATMEAELCVQDGIRSLALRLGWERGPSTATIPWFKENMVNCYLVKCTFRKLLLFLHGEVATWEVVIREIAHLGSCHLEKYPWEVATWESAFGKVPN